MVLMSSGVLCRSIARLICVNKAKNQLNLQEIYSPDNCSAVNSVQCCGQSQQQGLLSWWHHLSPMQAEDHWREDSLQIWKLCRREGLLLWSLSPQSLWAGRSWSTKGKAENIIFLNWSKITMDSIRQDPNWMCPPCMDICNCSICR